MKVSTIHGGKPPTYAALLRESASRATMAFQRDEAFARYQARTEFWAAFKKYRAKVTAQAALMIEKEGSVVH